MIAVFKRLAQCGLLTVLVMFTTAASDTAGRFNSLGHKIMCTCGCGQVLTQCNHLGCTSLATESGELKTAIDRGEGDNAIFIAFQNEYGPTVLAAPMFTRFNKAVWFVPPLFLLLGILGTVLLVRQWRMRSVAMPADPKTPGFETMRDRIRRETQL